MFFSVIGLLLSRLLGDPQNETKFGSGIAAGDGDYLMDETLLIPLTRFDIPKEEKPDEQSFDIERINRITVENDGTLIRIYYGKGDLLSRGVYRHVPTCPRVELLQSLSTLAECRAVLGKPRVVPEEHICDWGFFAIANRAFIEIVWATFQFSDAGKVISVHIWQGRADMSKITGIQRVEHEDEGIENRGAGHNPKK